MAIQTGTIAFLVLLYSGLQVKAYAFVILYTFACYALMSGLTPIDVLWSMQAFNLPILLAGKVIQKCLFLLYIFKFREITILMISVNTSLY